MGGTGPWIMHYMWTTKEAAWKPYDSGKQTAVGGLLNHESDLIKPFPDDKTFYLLSSFRVQLKTR